MAINKFDKYRQFITQMKASYPNVFKQILDSMNANEKQELNEMINIQLIKPTSYGR